MCGSPFTLVSFYARSASGGEPEYQDLRLEGALANSIQPWGLLAASVSLAVRDPQQTPYCSGSSEPQLSRVLGEEWPHEDILDALL